MKYYVILFMGMLFTKSMVYAQDSDSLYFEQPSEYIEETTASEETTTSPSYPPVNPGEVSQKKGYDREQINVKRFDPKKWEEVVGGKNYTEEKPAAKRKPQVEKGSERSPSSNSGKRVERRLQDDSEDPETSPSTMSPITSSILKIVFYALAIGIIGYILFLIIKNIPRTSKGKISKADLPDHSAPVEDIKELEIDRLLREALASGNYRLVIRIYFLGLLQKLDEDGFIVWKKDKTNRDYLSELFQKAHYLEVKSLTVAYEQVWYGDHNLPVQTYEQIISSFKAIDQKLKTSKPR